MAMGKKKIKLMEIHKKKFVDQAQEKGYSRNLLKNFRIYGKFAAYGFNKPHSASYGLIAYWTAYMKANYPVEYMAAVLSADLQGAAGAQRNKSFSGELKKHVRWVSLLHKQILIHLVLISQ